MATAVLSASEKEIGGGETQIPTQIPRTPSSGSSEGSDFVILSRPPGDQSNLGSPNDFTVDALTATQFSNGSSDGSTMMNADQLMSAFNGLKQENILLKGQLTEMNKAMQSRIVEIQGMREDQNRMNKDLKDKHQKAKKAVTHYQEQAKNVSQRLKELIEKDNESTLKIENQQKEMSRLQVELRKSQASAISHNAPPAPNSATSSNTTLSSPPSSLLTQLQEDLKNAQETRADMKNELEKWQEADRQSEETLLKASAISHNAPPAPNSATSSNTTLSSPPSSLLTQLQEDLKNAQETRADMKNELEKMQEADRQSEETLLKVNESELQRLQQALKRKDEEKHDLLKINQELQQKMDVFQQKNLPAQGLKVTEEESRQTQSLPSDTQSDGIFIEEEQGFSLMRDAEQSSKRFEDDVLKQLQKERERSDKLSVELKEKDDTCENLKGELEKVRKQLMNTSVSFEEEKCKQHEVHKAEVEDLERKVDELTMAAQEERHDSGVQLKQQVRTLVSEIQSREADIKDRDFTIDNLGAENAALREKLTMYYDDMEKEREQNTGLMDQLRVEMHRLKQLNDTYKAELQQKEGMFRGEKQKALHSVLEREKLQEEYDQLFADYDNLTRNYETQRVQFQKVQPMLTKQREIVENQDSLMARLLSAEEAIKAKDEENKELQDKIRQMKTDLETVPVLRAQAEVYKLDFDAERAAREKAHADKEVLMNELETLRAECEHAQQEAAQQAQPRVLEMQRRHGGDAAGGGGAGQQGQGEYGHLQTGGLDEWGLYQPFGHDNGVRNDYYGNDQAGLGANREGGQSHQQLDRNVTCPKCMEHFPDMDTLQIHMLDCIQ